MDLSKQIPDLNIDVYGTQICDASRLIDLNTAPEVFSSISSPEHAFEDIEHQVYDHVSDSIGTPIIQSTLLVASCSRDNNDHVPSSMGTPTIQSILPVSSCSRDNNDNVLGSMGTPNIQSTISVASCSRNNFDGAIIPYIPTDTIIHKNSTLLDDQRVQTTSIIISDNSVPVDVPANIDEEGVPGDKGPHMVEPENVEWWTKLEFSTVQECRDFYANYAHRSGFSWRIEHETKAKRSDEVHYIHYCCSKEGLSLTSPHHPNNVNPNHDALVSINTKIQVRQRQKRRAETRCGCKAHVYLSIAKPKNVYMIKRWAGEHNHNLHVREHSHMLKSNRRLTDAQAALAECVEQAGIALHSSYQLMCILAGGKDSLGFLKLDLKNHLSRRRQRSMIHGEGTLLQEYFRDQAFRNPGFFYEVAVDNDEKVTNIFWADQRMRNDYAHFGDSITFDTTFRTNKASRPLAIFVGFNHHKATCILGATLLYDETIESFVWLFNTFLRCMAGKAPKTIFTDQDAAMATAIRIVFPNVYHGLCVWHLLKNGMERLGPRYKDVRVPLKKLMYDVNTEDEFDQVWTNMVQSCFPENGVYGHPWLERIHGKRSQWSFAWVRWQFTAGIRSTQLSESFNASVKNYLQPDKDLDFFFEQYEAAVAHKRNVELLADFTDLDSTPPNDFPYSSIVNHAAEVYTRKIFEMFHEQYRHMFSFRLKEIQVFNSPGRRSFNIIHSMNGVEKETHVVNVEMSSITLDCSCRKFEIFGLLCGHILQVMNLFTISGSEEFARIPDKYILKRWRKLAKTDGVDMCKYKDSDGPIQNVDQYPKLMSVFIKVASLACGSGQQNLYDVATKDANALCQKLQNMVIAHDKNRDTQNDGDSTDLRGKSLKVKTNNIKSKRRLKSSLEIRQLSNRAKSKKAKTNHAQDK